MTALVRGSLVGYLFASFPVGWLVALGTVIPGDIPGIPMAARVAAMVGAACVGTRACFIGLFLDPTGTLVARDWLITRRFVADSGPVIRYRPYSGLGNRGGESKLLAVATVETTDGRCIPVQSTVALRRSFARKGIEPCTTMGHPLWRRK